MSGPGGSPGACRTQTQKVLRSMCISLRNPPFGNGDSFRQSVTNSSLNMIRLHAISSDGSLSSESAGGRGLTARQWSVAFYHLCHTGIWIWIHRWPSAAPRRSWYRRGRAAEGSARGRPQQAPLRPLHSTPLARFVCWRHTR